MLRPKGDRFAQLRFAWCWLGGVFGEFAENCVSAQQPRISVRAEPFGRAERVEELIPLGLSRLIRDCAHKAGLFVIEILGCDMEIELSEFKFELVIEDEIE